MTILDPYHFLIINILIISVPTWVFFAKPQWVRANWRALFTSIAITASLFLIWSELFTSLRVWGFNNRYVLGLYIGKMPIEEYALLLIIPFAGQFLSLVLHQILRAEVLNAYRLGLSFFFFLTSLILATYFYPRYYTSFVFYLVALLCALEMLVFRFSWFGRFISTFFIALIPFFLFDSWLTGSFTDEPIVWHNNLENMGLRIGTVPLEDIFYLFTLLFITTAFYERSKRKSLSARS